MPEPGRARRPARTGVFIIAGGASSAMDETSGGVLSTEGVVKNFKLETEPRDTSAS